MAQKKRRVLLKLSGEAFGGGTLGVNPDIVAEMAREIAEGAKTAEVAIVVGGGNFFRVLSFRSAAWIALALTTWVCWEPS
jgi:uridylate kinase